METCVVHAIKVILDKMTLDTVIAAIALIISIISLALSIHFWRRSFRPIVTAAISTHSSGNVGIVFNLEILNSGSLPAKNIQLKAKDIDINNAMVLNVSDEKKRAYLRCFESDCIIKILHNSAKVQCAFGNHEINGGFWKYNSTIPITIEYEGWFGKKYIETQELLIINSESFTDIAWK